ncbi:cytochrome P450 [Cyathus striatus]|nr:cytochrome P450 [Cyathus striatus]
MPFSIYVLALFATLAICYKIYRRLTRISISRISGPVPESFWLGNIPELFQAQAGETDFKWQETYGDVVRFKGAFGEDRLLISDPKALQYIYQTSGYNFPKQYSRREISKLISGKGISWAEGDVHRRHRKVMNPGFGGPESKAFVPIFTAQASHVSCCPPPWTSGGFSEYSYNDSSSCNIFQVSTKWRDMIAASEDQSAVVNVAPWASRAALDAIGEAAFDYKFGALDDENNPLRKAYDNILGSLFAAQTRTSLFIQELLLYLPSRFLSLMTDYAPIPRFVRVRKTGALAAEIAKSLIESKARALVEGNASRDIMTLLVRANNSESKKTRIENDELIAQMRTIMLAGHETTANSISWTLLELSRQPDIQKKLRAEINETLRAISARGNSEFTASDFDSMPYLNAVLKESLRYFSVAIFSFREAGKDDVLPLSKPIRTTTGEMINEIPISKGTKLVTSICGYNRNKDVFGRNAHVFNPDRWLNGQVSKTTPIGVYGNLMTFSAGIRSCIGWRFAVLELQAFLVELLRNFEFSMTPKAMNVRREPALVMIPTIEGEVDKGAQIYLRVRVVSDDE